jgi:hypothetical protein
LVQVIEESTLAFPVYDGNGMFLTVGNLEADPAVGLLFISFEDGSRLRVNGEASIDADDPLTDTIPGAMLVTRVRARAVFPNCRRYVHTNIDRQPSVFVPDGEAPPPVPDWKRDPWFVGTLPRGDPARDPDNPSAPSIPRF